MHKVDLPVTLLKQYCPFFMAIDRDNRIVDFGDKLQKILPQLAQQSRFDDFFYIERPQMQPHVDHIRQKPNMLYKIGITLRDDVRLKGGMVFDAEHDLVFFLGSPWLYGIQQLRTIGLSLHDFPVYDAVLEYLFTLQTAHASLEDARYLAQRLKQQRDQTVNSNLELLSVNQRLLQEIAVKEAIKKQLSKSEDKLKKAFLSARDVVTILDAEHRVVFVNPALSATYGYAQHQLLGQRLHTLLDADSQLLLSEKLQQLGVGQAIDTFRVTVVSYQGKMIATDVYLAQWESEAEVFYSCTLQDASRIVAAEAILLRDRTELERLVQQRTRQLSIANHKLKYRASHDDLTGLANRAYFMAIVQQKITEAKRNQLNMAIVFIDLDRFKYVNDSLGHQAGNQLLVEVARRLERNLRAGDIACRISGDEFALLMMHTAGETSSVNMMQRLLHAISLPMSIAGHSISIACSCGISLFPVDGNDADTLLKAADIAMYRAKMIEGTSFQYFEPSMQQAMDNRLTLETELRHAIKHDEFFLVYQPKIDIFTGQMLGAEALIRWQHPGKGVVAPIEFIALAEELGLILEIGELVLEKACSQLRAWADAGHEAVHLAVNLSAVQFLCSDIELLLEQLLQKYRLPAAVLELEITESMLMREPDKTIAKMNKCVAIGVKLAIDDFGTGYSNLSYLQKFPVDSLKIDKSFVKEMIHDPRTMGIVKTVISIAHSMGLQVVAEGVETIAQLSLLRQLGCGIIQGYLIAKPLAATAYIDFYLGFDFDNFFQAQLPAVAAVLVVDDDQNVLMAISRCLQRFRLPVITALDCESAYQLLAKENIAVIICDQQLGLEQGTDFLSRVKRMYPNISRMLITGQSDFTTASLAINEGEVQHIFTKPWDNEELLSQVKMGIKQHITNNTAGRAG